MREQPLELALEYRRFRRILGQDVVLFVRVLAQVVQFRSGRFNVLVLPQPQTAKRSPAESVVDVEAFAVNLARVRFLPGDHFRERAAFKRGRRRQAEEIKNGW